MSSWSWHRRRSNGADGLGRPPPHGDAFLDALDDAEELLKYVGEVGHPLPAQVINDILAARAALAANADSPAVRAAFYAAFTQLSAICGDVTARTIRYCSAPQTLRSLSRNRVLALTLTIIIAAVSVLTFVTDDMSRKIIADIATGNASAAALRAGLTDVNGNPARLNATFAKNDPCSLLETPPGDSDPAIRSVDDIIQLQQFAALNRDLLSRGLKLNRFIMRWECDPFGFQPCYSGGPQVSREAAVDLNNQLQINPAILNYTAEVLCKIKTYQQIRTFASNVQSDYSSLIGAFTAYALPILYAWLGAYAWRLRQFGETIRLKTYHPSFADSARMITAIIAGAIVGLFNPNQGVSLSPLATAFLVGYGVELFFRFLDTMINFGAPPRTGPVRPTQ